MLNHAMQEATTHASTQVLCKLIKTKDFNLKMELAKTLRLYFPSPITPLDKDELKEYQSPGRPDEVQVLKQDDFNQDKFSEYRSQVEYLHALANIELLAIEITALCLIKFGSQDQNFIRRQLLTISEKAEHFYMINERLKDFNMEFGTLPVNQRYWEYALKCKTELDLQVLVACYLEARRLDLSPVFLKKMIKAGDERTARIIKVILAEEVKHVKMGMAYLKQRSHEKESNPDQLFKGIIKRVVTSEVKSDFPINEEYRKLAGFTKDQINLLKTGA